MLLGRAEPPKGLPERLMILDSEAIAVSGRFCIVKKSTCIIPFSIPAKTVDDERDGKLRQLIGP